MLVSMDLAYVDLCLQFKLGKISIFLISQFLIKKTYKNKIIVVD